MRERYEGFSFLLRILSKADAFLIAMTNEVMITEDMLKDCDKNFLEGSFEGVENTPPVVTNRDDDLIQMMDQIKFLKTKLSERDREIGFLKQDVERTLDVSFEYQFLYFKLVKNYIVLIHKALFFFSLIYSSFFKKISSNVKPVRTWKFKFFAKNPKMIQRRSLS